MEINEKEIFGHMNLQQIVDFILDERHEPIKIDSRTYDERLEYGNAPMLKRLETLFKDDERLSEGRNDFYYALAVNRDVIFEMGMKAGARLIFQLLREDT